MTNDELQKLAAALGDCGKALLKISEAMAVKEDNPTASEAKSEKLEKPLTLEDVRKVAADKARKGESRTKFAALSRSTGRTSCPALMRHSMKRS